MAEKREPAELADGQQLAFSYDWQVDVNTAATGPEKWQRVRFISAVNPQVTPVTQSAATYEDQGSPADIKTSEQWTLSFYVQDVTENGAPLPEVARLEELAGPDATGEKAFGQFRWFDAPFNDSRPAVKTRAWEGVGTVQMERAETGNDGIGGWNITVTGKGRRKQITNPLAPASPGPGA